MATRTKAIIVNFDIHDEVACRVVRFKFLLFAIVVWPYLYNIDKEMKDERERERKRGKGGLMDFYGIGWREGGETWKCVEGGGREGII